MNKAELVKEVAEKTELTQKDVTMVLDAVISAITGQLIKGEDVSIAGFGKFVVRKRAARTSINPRTKQEVSIPASKAPAYRPGKALKDSLIKKKKKNKPTNYFYEY